MASLASTRKKKEKKLKVDSGNGSSVAGDKKRGKYVVIREPALEWTNLHDDFLCKALREYGSFDNWNNVRSDPRYELLWPYSLDLVKGRVSV